MPTESGSTRLSDGNVVTSTCPGKALAAVDGMALSPSGNNTTSSKRANGPRSANGMIAGTATSSIPPIMRRGCRSPSLLRAAKSASSATGHAVNFMADAMPSATPDAKGWRRWASTIARSRNAATGMSSPPVASGREANGQDHQGLERPDFAPALRPAEIERHGCHGQGREAEEDARVAQAVRRPDVAGDPEHRHHRQIGQEACVVRLSRGVVLHGVRQLDQRVVGLLPLDQVLASHFDRLDFGLQVRPGHAVETPEDLEPQWYGERPGEDADRHREACEPGPTVLGRSESGPAPTRPSARVPERPAETTAPNAKGVRAMRPHTWYSPLVEV